MASRPFLPHDAVSLPQLSDPQLSPDGRHVAYVQTVLDETRKEYLSHIRLAAPVGGPSRRLTTGPGRDGEPRFSPDGLTLAFLSDRDAPQPGAPRQIWLLPLQGGEAVPLTGVAGGASQIEWSPDGQHLLFVATPPPGAQEQALTERGGIRIVDHFLRQPQVWCVEVASGTCRQVTADATAKAAPRWSPDGGRILYEEREDATANQQYRTRLCTVQQNGRGRAVVGRGTTCETRGRWSPDGRRVAFLRREQPCYHYVDHLVVRSTEGRGRERLLTLHLDRSVLDYQWLPDGQLVVLLHDGLRAHLHRLDPASGQLQPLTRGNGVVSGLSAVAADGALVFLWATPTRPGQVHVTSTSSPDPRPLTSARQHLSPHALATTRRFAWRAPDGLSLEGVLLLPAGRAQGGALPLVVEPHGGPCGSRGFDFYARWQALAAAGWAVFAPNFRGSAGYGQAFASANLDDFGGGDFADVMSGVDALVEQGIADPQRLAIMGYSYGGYLTAWAVGHTDRFRAAVVGAGVTNLHSFYGTSDIQWFTRQYQRGTPWETPAAYVRQSPITHVDRVRTPTLIYHGDEDRRVPVEQSEQLYVSLRERGVPTQLVRYPREKHGLEEYFHRLDEIERSLAWLARYVLQG